jgi:aminodeoxyfutalosine deaminase
VQFIKGYKIFDGKRYLEDGSVLVYNGQGELTDIVKEEDLDESAVLSYEGILTPGFVNAHCHLELSHLLDRIPRHTGLPGFASAILKLRNRITAEEAEEAMISADAVMWQKGIVATGDISNDESSFSVKKNSAVHYHTFIELIALHPDNCEPVFGKGLQLLQRLKSAGLKGSLAPHAPYSCSNQLIGLLAMFDEKYKLPLSIHNQECPDENKFFKGEPNGFDSLYKELDLDISFFKPPGTTSLQAYSPRLAAGNSILVHNTFTSAEDINAVKEKNVYWCFCPKANLYIENRLPDLSLYKAFSDRVCMGTDSLASNDTLDLLEEVNVLLASDSTPSPELLLSAITSNGAAALGIGDRFGSLTPGRKAGLNLVSFTDNRFNFLKKIF